MRPSDVAGGFLVVDRSRAAGGVTYQRTPVGEVAIRRGRGARLEVRATRTIDSRAAVKVLDRIVKQADYACRVACAKTGLGWFTTEDRLPDLRRDFARLAAEADLLNVEAARLGSARRAVVAFVAAPVNGDCLGAAAAIGDSVQEVLRGAHAALRAGHAVRGDDALHAHVVQAKNLELVAAPGEPRRCLAAALDAIPAARSELLFQVRHGALPAAAGADLDLAAIEAAIARFSATSEDLVRGRTARGTAEVTS